MIFVCKMGRTIPLYNERLMSSKDLIGKIIKTFNLQVSVYENKNYSNISRIYLDIDD